MRLRHKLLVIGLSAVMALQMAQPAFAKGLKLSSSAATATTSPTSEVGGTSASQETTDVLASQLSTKEKTVYDAIVKALESRKTSLTVTLGATTASERKTLFAKVVQLVARQHPEFYWLSDQQSVSWKMVTSGNSMKSTMTIKFSTLSGYTNSTQQKIDQSVEKSLASIKEKLPDGEYDKIRYLYQWVIARGSYDWDEIEKSNKTGKISSSTDYNIVGVMVNKKGVCQSYADTFQFLCNQFDIPCITVVGIGNYGKGDMTHSWNYVKVKDAWYLVDTTWADTFTNGQNQFLLLGSESQVKPGVSVAKAYEPGDDSYFILPTLSKKPYSAK